MQIPIASLAGNLGQIPSPVLPLTHHKRVRILCAS